MLRKLSRIVLTLTGLLVLIFAVCLVGPTGAKATFVRLVMTPKADRMHKDLSSAMKLDDEASAALKRALSAMATHNGAVILIAIGFSSAAIGTSLIALSASLNRSPIVIPEHTVK